MTDIIKPINNAIIFITIALIDHSFIIVYPNIFDTKYNNIQIMNEKKSPNPMISPQSECLCIFIC